MVELAPAISSALMILKGLRAIDARLREAELRGAIADLALALADIKEKAAELQAENLQLRGLLDALREKEDIGGKVKLEKGAYWLSSTSGKSGPFCTRCYDSEQKLINLSALTGPFKVFGSHECPNCKSSTTVG